MNKLAQNFVYLSLAIILFGVSGCAGNPTNIPTSTAAVETLIATAIPSTPTPEPVGMSVCIGTEPESLFLYSSARSQSTWSVLEGLYDGPIDFVQYEYLPVILEKIPNLQDGDAQLSPVTVKEGMDIVDIDGNLQSLQKGVTYLPSGCSSGECAKQYAGTGDVQMDQLMVTYKLKAGLTWSDGTPLKASDSVFSFRLASDPGYSGSKELIRKTAQYSATDELSAVWLGVPGFRDQQYMTHFWIPQPEHIFSGKDFASIASDPLATEKPLSWGPFMVKEWVAGDHITLVKNPAYFRTSEGLPKVDFIQFRFLETTPEQSLEALLTGACDILDESTLLDEQISTILELQQAGKLTAAITPSPVWEGLYFGITPSSYDDGFSPNLGDRQDILGDQRTRQALAMCINRQKIVDELWAGASAIPVSYLGTGSPIALPTDAAILFDPDKGSALLDEIGWKDMDKNPLTPRVAVNIPTVFLGTPLQFTYYTSNAELRKKVSAQIASDMAACGIPVDLKYLAPEELFKEGPSGVLFGRKFDLAQFSWSPSTMPPCRFYITNQINTAKSFWFGVNISGYSSKEYDSACQTASNVLPGETDYNTLQQKTQELFNQNLPAFPLYQLVRIGITRPGVCSYRMDATSRSSLWNLERIDPRDGCVNE